MIFGCFWQFSRGFPWFFRSRHLRSSDFPQKCFIWTQMGKLLTGYPPGGGFGRFRWFFGCEMAVLTFLIVKGPMIDLPIMVCVLALFTLLRWVSGTLGPLIRPLMSVNYSIIYSQTCYVTDIAIIT